MLLIWALGNDKDIELTYHYELPLTPNTAQ
jgi:hypothetical protein